MTIREFLDQYIIKHEDDLKTRLQKYFTWMGLLRDLDRNNQSLKWFFDLLELSLYLRTPTAETLLQFFIDIGVDVDRVSIDEFFEKTKGFSELGIRLSKVPNFPFDLYDELKNELDEITALDIKNLLVSKNFIKQDFNRLHFYDAKYYVGSKATVDKILDAVTIYHLRYITQRFDCDDFSLTFKAFLSLHKLGNYAAGMLIAEFDDPDTERYMFHAINLLLYKDENGNLDFVLYEPQSENYFYKKGSGKKEWEKIDPYLIVF